MQFFDQFDLRAVLGKVALDAKPAFLRELAEPIEDFVGAGGRKARGQNRLDAGKARGSFQPAQRFALRLFGGLLALTAVAGPC